MPALTVDLWICGSGFYQTSGSTSVDEMTSKSPLTVKTPHWNSNNVDYVLFYFSLKFGALVSEMKCKIYFQV